MRSSSLGPCPHCDSELEEGYLGFASGLFWSRHALKGWRSLFPVALSFGEFVVGSLASTPWFRTRPAHRCSVCGALVIPADRL